MSSLFHFDSFLIIIKPTLCFMFVLREARRVASNSWRAGELNWTLRCAFKLPCWIFLEEAGLPFCVTAHCVDGEDEPSGKKNPPFASPASLLTRVALCVWLWESFLLQEQHSSLSEASSALTQNGWLLAEGTERHEQHCCELRASATEAELYIH